MNVLITGAAGYLGSSLVREVSKFAENVFAFDNLFYDQGTLVAETLKR